ncbi:CRISPR-associated protein Cas5 [Streptomyces lydicus]|uniref:CRISPR-associated protein Cas5 n=1 Tax=Streptomyces lydicus TaxID=47763 RepID=UPI0038241E80
MTGIEALEATITAPVASFRNPLYTGVQVTLPCPPPSTIGGMLAASAGSWDKVPHDFRFAAAFHAEGRGTDLETYHPLPTARKPGNYGPQNREFLAFTTLKIWILDNLDQWEHRLRRPVWPMRLGRSQDLAALTTRRTTLTTAPGEQHGALITDHPAAGGTSLRVPTAITLDRGRTLWGSYRYDPTGHTTATVPDSYSTPTGQAVALLPPTHPATAERV